MSDKEINLVIVTGMSGAGKTVAIQSFEDLGYFTIDNMPPTLVPKFIELVEKQVTIIVLLLWWTCVVVSSSTKLLLF